MPRLSRMLSATVSSRPLAIARIGIAFAILLEGRNSGITLLDLARPGILRAPWFEPAVPMSEPLALALIGLWIASSIGLMIGFRARISGAVLTGVLAATLLIDQQLYSNHLYLMFLLAGLLTVSDSGAALSVDAWLGGERATVPAWPVTLLKVQASLMYGFAALAKLNPDFLSGSVVASYLRREGPLAVPDMWRGLEPMLVLALLAVCAEAFLSVALWSNRWRPTALVVGLGLHAGIALWFTPTFALFVFSAVSLPLYVLFLNPERGRIVLVWDDGCRFCRTWVTWFRRFDWLDALRLVPRSELPSSGLPVTEEMALRALQAVEFGSGPDGAPVAVRGGFAGVTRVFEALPITFLWAPLLRLPPVAWIGERWYCRVAARRLCEVAPAHA